jgi:hypothetical protein
MVIPPALLRPLRTRPDLAQFEKFEAERFDLPNDAEHRGPILKPAGEHGVAARRLRHHRGECGQNGSSEPTPYPDRVQALQCGHGIIVRSDLVSGRRRNQVITPADTRAISAMLARAGLREAGAGVRVERRQSDHARRAWHRCCGYEY